MWTNTDYELAEISDAINIEKERTEETDEEQLKRRNCTDC